MLPSLSEAEIKGLATEFKDLFEAIEEKMEDYNKKMENMFIRDGLFLVMRISERGNLFLQQTEYWKLFKNDKKACDKVV